jgi:hypothetical protein
MILIYSYGLKPNKRDSRGRYEQDQAIDDAIIRVVRVYKAGERGRVIVNQINYFRTNRAYI